MIDHNNNDHKEKDIDDVTGVETTGHEWDGLKELNNPLPRWWVWVFIATCVWSAWYMVVYPAWPTLSGATEGISGYTQFNELEKSQLEIQARQEVYLERFEKASDQEVLNNPELYAFAIAGGQSAFKDNCATCHGTGAEGGKGYPNLNDDDWLWGGTLSAIHETLLYGIRSDHEDTRVSQMPAFGKDKTLNREEIYAVVDYVLTLSGAEKKETYAQGAEIYQQQCATCHAADGSGMQSVGSPNLTDKIWLYGSSRQALYETIFYSRAGVMPAFGERLDDNTIRQLTIYLHELGDGEEKVAAPDEGLTRPAPLVSYEYENPEAPREDVVEAVEDKLGDEL